MEFKTDIQIAQECQMAPITEIAAKAGIDDKYLEQYGKYKAKIDYNLLRESDKKEIERIMPEEPKEVSKDYVEQSLEVAQPMFCLSHYERLVNGAEKKLLKKSMLHSHTL